MPDYAAAILEHLAQRGYETYAVGGCVRDALLGREPDDWDLTTAATPEEIVAAFPDHRVIETGMKHGTVTVLSDGHPVEVTTFRVDGTYSDNRHPDRVVFTRSLREDLARRDLTVNALAWDPQKGIVDLFGGQKDLEDKVLRCVGNPQQRFREDALRVLRVVRFASTLGFSIEKNTAAAVHTSTLLLHNVSAERIAVELTKLLSGRSVKEVLEQYSDVITTVLPELRDAVDFAQPTPYHLYDVYTHTALVVKNTPADDTVLRLAALLHDCGKPRCFCRDAKGAHFKGHPAVGAEMARHALRRLRFDNRTVDEVTELILCHDEDVAATSSSLLHWLSRLGEVGLRRLIALKRADAMAKAPAVIDNDLAELDKAEAVLNELLADRPCYSLAQLAVKGDDLLALGVPPGSMVGQLLNILLEAVIDGRCRNDREALLTVLRDLYLPQ